MNTSLDDFVKALPEPPEPPPVLTMPKNGIAWCALKASQGNCDSLPSWLSPSQGCPKCGSVWTDVHSIAFSNECWRGVLDEKTGWVMQVGDLVPPMAVRLRCFMDHIVEYDGSRFTVLPPVAWSAGIGLAVAGAIGLWATMYAFKGAPGSTP